MANCIELDHIESWEYVNEPIVYDLTIEDNHNYHIDCVYPYLVHNSLKTFSASELFVIRSIQNRNQIRLINGWDMPHMKRGCITDMLRIFQLYPKAKRELKSYNQQETKLYFHSGSTIQFASFQDEQDAKMTDIQDFYMNECNLTKNGYGIYNQMKMQCKGQAYLDYNSMFPFWVHAKLVGRPDVKMFINDHRNNPFLSEEQHRIIENQYPKGSELWKVYARGLTGMLEGAIYANWTRITDWRGDDLETVCWGVDFGYTVGMTAIDKIGIIAGPKKKARIKLCVYEPGISAAAIAQVLKEHGYVSGQYVFCDHDDVMISELRNLGISAYPAKKGELSEWNGILKCQEYEVEYVYSEPLETERISYQWDTVTSLETGDEVVTQSVKDTKKYHAMAAFRMGLWSYCLTNGI